jgi:hypothetical protein
MSRGCARHTLARFTLTSLAACDQLARILLIGRVVVVVVVVVVAVAAAVAAAAAAVVVAVAVAVVVPYTSVTKATSDRARSPTRPRLILVP